MEILKKVHTSVKIKKKTKKIEEAENEKRATLASRIYTLKTTPCNPVAYSARVKISPTEMLHRLIHTLHIHIHKLLTLTPAGM